MIAVLVIVGLAVSYGVVFVLGAVWERSEMRGRVSYAWAIIRGRSDA